MIDSLHPLFEGQDLDYQNIFVNVDENVISVEDACKEIQKLDYVSKTQTQNDWRENINSVMSGILVMTNAVKIFAILLALVVLYNLALMNYKQRTRDIATLKVLGFFKKEIALSLLIESLTLTFIGSLIGLALGYPFMLAVMETNRVTLVEYLYNINLLTYAISFILTFIVSVVINSYFSFMTRRIQMVESLKSVE
jgi:putative ABC transport system permease protein